MITFLIISLLFQTPDPSGDTSPTEFGVLFHGTGSADIRQGLSTLRTDTLTAFPRAVYRDDMFHIEATAALEYRTDSLKLQPVSAGGFFRWPGSPWISSGVFLGLKDPFLPGLNAPVREWRSTGVTDITGISAEAGGILGFRGFWNQYGDSLSWYGVNSPWLGVGMLSWNGLGRDTLSCETYNGFIDLRKMQAWFVVIGDEDLWSAEAEIRGLEAFSSPIMAIEVVPRIDWSEDSTRIELSGFITSRVRSFSGRFTAGANADSLDAPDVNAGFDLLDKAGVQWSLTLGLDHLEDLTAVASGEYRASPVGCGGSISLVDDSLSITAMALYSPVRGVSSKLSINTDLSTNSPDPGCLFGVYGSGGQGSAGFTVRWKDGITELGLGVSAWID
jgi:hypothetical protein